MDSFPKGGFDVFQTSLPPFLILISPIPPPIFKESLDIPIIYTMTAPTQHKQRYYYIFWSIATLAVVCGQIYVASGYRSLSEALKLSLL